ncbi:MAG: hypothetical protein JWM85_1705 [Acidimicrobiaceae bacterium]|nr:hypothetical protein [Acidimicrobiaceae bacterium]
MPRTDLAGSERDATGLGTASPARPKFEASDPAAIGGLGSTPASDVERWFARAGRPPMADLARSGAPARSIAEVLSASSRRERQAFLSLSLEYGAVGGTSELRQAVVDAGHARASEEVVVTNGAIEALLLACAALARTGRPILVAAPAYEGLLRCAQAAGAQVRPVPVWRTSAPGLDLSGFSDQAIEAADAVILNSPHNPTGLRFAPEELEDLLARCARRGVTVVVDEVALGTLDRAAASVSGAAGFAAGFVVAIGDVSKSLGLGGLRIGWLTTASPDLARRITALRDLTSLGSSGPSQYLAALALSAGPDPALAELAEGNLACLDAWVAARGGSLCARPADGLVAFPALDLGRSSVEFAELAHQAGVSVMPGSFFGHEGHLRVGLGLRPQVFSGALATLDSLLVPSTRRPLSDRATEPSCTVVIPAYNEAGSIEAVVGGVPGCLDAEVIVVDNASTDGTAQAALRAGARVVREEARGYGRACLAGARAARASRVVVFVDGDGSMDPADIPALVAPILEGKADLVCGSRTARAEPGSLPAHQRLGNALAVLLLSVLYGVRLSELGPYRAIEAGLLRDLGIRGSRYAWVAELPARAARRGGRIVEMDVAYRRRTAGASKVSGTLRGSLGAGAAIVSTLLWTRVRPAKRPTGASASVERTGATRPLTRGVALVGGLGALVPIGLYLFVAVHRIGYHFELEWLEGGAVGLVDRVVHGHDLYGPPSLTSVPWPYPPLYFWVSAALAKIIGVGFLAPRLISFSASIGSLLLLARIVWEETRSWSGGLVAAGLFAAAFHASGDWYDLARVDSLFIFLTLLTLYLARRATTVRAGAVVGLFGFLAFFTKQSAALGVAFALVFLLTWRPKVGSSAIGVAGGLAALSTVVMDAVTHGWYRYYVFQELPGQGLVAHNASHFWTRTLWHDSHPIVIVGIGLVLAGLAGRNHRLAMGYWCAAAAGLLATAWLSQQHVGGYLDVLMPAFAALALGGGLAWGWTLGTSPTARSAPPAAKLGRSRPALRAALFAAVAASVSLQLANWWYPAARQIPTSADARAGAQLLSAIRAIPGQVVVLNHPWYAEEAGKAPSGQGEAIRDIIRAGPSPARRALEANLRRQLSSVNALILDDPGDEIGIASVIGRQFVRTTLDWHPGSAFHEVDDLGLRPSELFVRRSKSAK